MGEGGGLVPSAIFCVWASPLPRKSERFKSGGRAGSAFPGVAWQPQATLSQKARVQRPLIF